MKVIVVAYDGCFTKIFTNEKEALQYLINNEIEYGSFSEKDRKNLENFSLTDWCEELRGICSIYTETLC